MAFADDLAIEFVSLSVNALRFGEGVRRRSIGFLRELEADLVRQLQEIDPTGPTRETFRVRRLEALLDQTRDSIRQSIGEARKSTRSELVDLAGVEAEAVPAAFNRTIRASVISTALSPADLRAIVDQDALIVGRPLREFWDQIGTETTARFAQQVRLGLGAGEPIDEIVRRIRGRATGSFVDVGGRKVREFAGGIFDTTTRQATTLVRTAVHSVANRVAEETWKQNADLVGGLQTLATLDGRTSTICIARSGGAWDAETGEPLPQSSVTYRFPGFPPWHPNCRTIIIPITRSWSELVEAATGRKLKILETVPDSTRASMNGQVAGELTYPDWLRTQPRSFQVGVLGKARWELWQEGKITLAQLVDLNGRELSIEELRSLSGLKPRPPVAPKKKAVAKATRSKIPDRSKEPSGDASSNPRLWSGDKVSREVQRALGKDAEAIRALVARRELLDKEHQTACKDYVATFGSRASDEARERARSQANRVAVELSAVNDQIEKAHGAFRKKVLPFVSAENPSNLHWDLKRPASSGKVLRESLDSGIAFLRAVVDRSVFDSDRVEFRAYVDDGLQRAFFSKGFGATFGPFADGRTVVHEFGHGIEFAGAGLLKNSLDFLKNRAAADPRGRRLLSEITGRDFAGNEWAWEDEFLSAYMGKDYDGHATELLSMGLDMLYDRPWELLRDSSYFAWLIDTIRGRRRR